MQSRYLGSDEAIAAQDKAIEAANNSNLQAIDSISKATGGYIDSVVQGQSQVAKLDLVRQTALAQSQQNWKGFGDAIQTGVQAYGNYKLKENQQELDRQAAADKRNAEYNRLYQEEREFGLKREELQLKKDEIDAKGHQAALKTAGEQEYTAAVDRIGQLEAKYEGNNWAEGQENFKTEASKILANYKYLSPENQARLLDRVNGSLVARSKKIGGELHDETTKLKNQQAETNNLRFLISMQPKLQQIKNMGATEQASEALKEISRAADDYMNEDNGMSASQKVAGINQVLAAANVMYGEKSATYIKLVQDTKALNTWNAVLAEATAKLNAGGSYEDYKFAVAKLKIDTGRDYEKAFVGIGEKDRLAVENAQNVAAMDKLREEAIKKTGANFEFDPGVLRAMAAGLVINPSLRSRFETDPLLKDNVGIREAKSIAARIQQAREAEAALGIKDGKRGEEIAALNFTKASNVTAMARDIQSKVQSGKQLSPAEELLDRRLAILAQTNPEIGELLLRPPATSEAEKQRQVAELQKLLTAENTVILERQNAVTQTFQKEVVEFQTKYADVYQRFGKIPTDEDLKKIYTSSQSTINQATQRYQQALDQASQNATPNSFGSTANFSRGSGSLAAYSSPNGSYKVAPRTAVQVQSKPKDGGIPFVTPIKAGVVAPHSFNTGYMGGGYKAGRSNHREHAGIDFPLAAGQPAVALVSGTVVKIGNDPKGYGNYIDYRGDNGFVYRYAHQRTFAKVGERLEPGQAISTPNGSGVGGAHLHFEVRTPDGYRNSEFGIEGTLNPVAHLRELTKQAGTTIGGGTPGLRNHQQTKAPGFLRTERNTLFVPAGGAIQGGLFQQVNRQTQSASSVFTNQRPLAKSGGVGWTAGTPNYDENNDLGYAYLRQNADVRVALVRAARTLRVPPEWIADIVAQETSWGREVTGYHGNTRGENRNRNYGMFGFGTDSGVPNYNKLTPVQQVAAYTKYMITNGWLKHVDKVGASNTNILQLWSITKMGTNWRNKILNGVDPNTLVDETGYSQADQARMLGNKVGREYAVPGGRRSERSTRNRAIRKRADSNLSQNLVANNSPDVASRDDA